MKKIRVLIVEDSLTIRCYLQHVLAADPQLDVVGIADNGEVGIAMCEQMRPDIVTMDLMLPRMTGLTATEHIMAYCPTPILIISSSFNRNGMLQTYEALAAGAIEVLEKPSGISTDPAWEDRCRRLVKLVARIPVITHPRARLRPHRPETPTSPVAVVEKAGDSSSVVSQHSLSSAYSFPLGTATAMPSSSALSGSSLPSGSLSKTTLSVSPRLVALGASTGGPRALAEILGHLPKSFSLPCLVVLHMGMAFGQGFVEWLRTRTSLPVHMAQDGMPLPPVGSPGIWVAPPGSHLVLRSERLHLTDAPERHACRPSVDVLFESLASDVGAACIACLLTGMGKDGAVGLHQIRQAGGVTCAQDEASSVIFGMPRAAIDMGGVQYILPLQDFAPTLLQLAKGGVYVTSNSDRR